MKPLRTVPASVRVVCKHGPLTLRDVSALTAAELGCSTFYEDVEAVLHTAMERGEVKIMHGSEDFREVIWGAA